MKYFVLLASAFGLLASIPPAHAQPRPLKAEDAAAIRDENSLAPKRIDYRKRAFAHYDPVCAHCGYGIPDILEVAHIDGSRQNNEISNLVILCPNCHKMHDL
ncbi:MAG: HNH endonuclease [Chthoniobacterales bacterium]|nr:HNH endonuclease [Chthoniobacterales bacterium]